MKVKFEIVECKGKYAIRMIKTRFLFREVRYLDEAGFDWHEPKLDYCFMRLDQTGEAIEAYKKHEDKKRQEIKDNRERVRLAKRGKPI